MKQGRKKRIKDYKKINSNGLDTLTLNGYYYYYYYYFLSPPAQSRKQEN